MIDCNEQAKYIWKGVWLMLRGGTASLANPHLPYFVWTFKEQFHVDSTVGKYLKKSSHNESVIDQTGTVAIQKSPT